jgi:hypothetical protein
MGASQGGRIVRRDANYGARTSGEGLQQDFREVVGGSVKNELMVIADNTFTTHNAVIVVCRRAKGNSFHFQVPMLTG